MWEDDRISVRERPQPPVMTSSVQGIGETYLGQGTKSGRYLLFLILKAITRSHFH
jgi:hypothetical protein